MSDEKYPHDIGDDIALGPQVIAKRDESVINWKGRNYVPADENARLRAVAAAVRAMWDNIVGTADEDIMGFPVADYIAIEAALDRLDETTTGENT